MKRIAALFALAVILGGCSVSINEDSPQVVVVASATAMPNLTPTEDAYYVEFVGTLKVSGPAVTLVSTADCTVEGIAIFPEKGKGYWMTTTVGGYSAGAITLDMATRHEGECWFPFTGFSGYRLDATVLFGVPGTGPVLVPYDDIKYGGPVTLTLNTTP